MRNCNNRGNTTPHNTVLCDHCGTRQSGKNEEERRIRISVRPVIIGVALVFIAVTILFTCGVIGFGSKEIGFPEATPKTDIPLPSKGEEMKSHAISFEGPGYPSAEDALRAYADALKAEDLDAVVKTFCIETWCENVDYVKYCYLWNGKMIPSESMTAVAQWIGDIPPVSDKRADLRRYEVILDTFRMIHYLTFYGNDDFDFLWDYLRDWQFANEQEEQEMIARYREIIRENMPDLSTLQFVRSYTPEEVGTLIKDTQSFSEEARINGEGWWSARLQEVREIAKDYYGADELKEMGAVFHIDGREWFLTVRTARFDDRWYVMSTLDASLRLFIPDGYDLGVFGIMPLDRVLQVEE